MNEHLRDLLDPSDDGRAFTDAVLLRASGALARRRAAAAAAAANGSPWAWLEAWARPWLVAAALTAAVLALWPALGTARSSVAAAESEPAEVLLATEQPEVAFTVSFAR